MLKLLWKKYFYHQAKINRVLIVFSFLFLLVYIFKVECNNGIIKKAYLFFYQHIDGFNKLSLFIRNIVYTGAIILAGLWSYYTFAKGRTFVERLNINITLKGYKENNPRIAIIGFNLVNVGKWV